MCGFVGFTHQNKSNGTEIITKMSDTIYHRGPDDYGTFVNKEVALGFRRLSIIDLSTAGHQPMVSEDEQVVLVFNGEIYNHKALKNDFIDMGYTFHSTTDSEVLLVGYQIYGIEILSKLRGMFAFTIYDKNKDVMYIARDHFGIKPMYYTQNTTHGDLIFGSEIKSFFNHPDFIKSLNKKALKPYLMFQYSALDETFFEGVHKLPPCHYLEYRQGTVQIKAYDRLEFNGKDGVTVDDVHDAIAESVELHKASDVKVGAFLSGGVDSSYLVSLLRPEKTFSVGFAGYESIFDETNIAKSLAESLGIEHHIKMITGEEFFDKVPTIQYHMDEPHANLSSVPLYFLSELASQHVTVVLSGEGADELFGGYDWYYQSDYVKAFKKLPKCIQKSFAGVAKVSPNNRISRFILNANEPIEDSFIGQAKVFSKHDVDEVLKNEFVDGPCSKEVTKKVYKQCETDDDLTKMQMLDLNKWLPGDILQKADKMSMAHSIELRVPYLDIEVFDVAAKIPANKRIEGKSMKAYLRKGAAKVLPAEWFKRKKVGFPVPIRHWLREEKYYDHVKEVLLSQTSSKFFKQDILEKYLTEHFKGDSNHARYIWTVYVFLVWYEEYFNEN